MEKKEYFNLDRVELEKLPKAKLIDIIFEQYEIFSLQIEEKQKKLTDLSEQLAKANQEQDEHKKKKINKEVNQPTSKKPEWDKDGNPKPKGKKRKKKTKRKKRPGSGNVKKIKVVAETNHIPLDDCPNCGMDLSNKEGTPKAGRTVEDIEPPQETTTLSKEIEQSKWCPKCKLIVSSKTEKALPGSDIGLNATIEMA